MLVEVGCCEGSLRAHRHAEDPTVFTWDPHISRRSVENMGLHYVHPQKAPTDGENKFEFEHDTCAPVTNRHINDHSGCNVNFLICVKQNLGELSILSASSVLGFSNHITMFCL